MANERIAREFGLGLVEVQLLHLLLLHPDVTTASALIARTGLPSSTVSDMVHRLVRLGLLERTRSQSDRRPVILQPTAAWSRIAERYRTGDMAAKMLDALTGLSPEKIEGLISYFTRLNAAVDDSQATADPLRSWGTS